jgi:hypothetical protein
VRGVAAVNGGSDFADVSLVAHAGGLSVVDVTGRDNAGLPPTPLATLTSLGPVLSVDVIDPAGSQSRRAVVVSATQLCTIDFKDALEASEAVAAESRAEAVSMIGGDVTVETFEQVVGEVGNPPPAKGCLVRFVSFETDPARVDENVAYFRAEVLPAIKESPGFRAVRNLINRTTGRGLTAIIVSDTDALTAAEVSFEARREKGEVHGIRFGEITHREVVLVDKL